MEGGPPGFPPGFTCPAVLGMAAPGDWRFRVRGCHPVPPSFPARSATAVLCDLAGEMANAKAVLKGLVKIKGNVTKALKLLGPHDVISECKKLGGKTEW